jgi:hypothetical protein
MGIIYDLHKYELILLALAINLTFCSFDWLKCLYFLFIPLHKVSKLWQPKVLQTKVFLKIYKRNVMF